MYDKVNSCIFNPLFSIHRYSVTFRILRKLFLHFQSTDLSILINLPFRSFFFKNFHYYDLILQY